MRKTLAVLLLTASLAACDLSFDLDIRSPGGAGLEAWASCGSGSCEPSGSGADAGSIELRGPAADASARAPDDDPRRVLSDEESGEPPSR